MITCDTAGRPGVLRLNIVILSPSVRLKLEAKRS